MKVKGKLNFNINKIIAYFLAGCIILSVSTMYSNLTNLSINAHYFELGVCIFSVLGVLCLRKIYAKVFIWEALLALFFIFFYFVNDRSSDYILYFVVPTLCLFFYIYTVIKIHKFNYFTEAFIMLIVIEAAVSVFFYLFGTILNILPGRTNLIYHWANANRKCSTYFYLYFDNTAQATTIFSHYLMRNTGIFPEAPGHSGTIAYGMIFVLLDLRKDPKKSKVPIIILTIAMVTTFSTKGFLLLIIIALGWYLISMDDKNVTGYIIATVLIILGVIVAYYVMIDKSITSSYNIRMDDIVAQLKAWRENIVFGVGYSNADEIVKYFTVHRSNDGLSMGIFNILARGGLYLFSLYVYAAIRYFYIENRNGRGKESLLVLAILITNLFISTMGFTMSYMMFLSIGLSIGEDKISIST